MTNKYGTSIVHIPRIATVKLEPIDDNILVMLDAHDDVCHEVDLFDTSPLPSKVHILCHESLDLIPLNLHTVFNT